MFFSKKQNTPCLLITLTLSEHHAPTKVYPNNPTPKPSRTTHAATHHPKSCVLSPLCHGASSLPITFL
jgi:hypothetical protein